MNHGNANNKYLSFNKHMKKKQDKQQTNIPNE